MLRLKEQYTIVLVTNNTKQAARVADRTAFFLMGELIEIDKTHKIFTAPGTGGQRSIYRGSLGNHDRGRGRFGTCPYGVNYA